MFLILLTKKAPSVSIQLYVKSTLHNHSHTDTSSFVNVQLCISADIKRKPNSPLVPAELQLHRPDHWRKSEAQNDIKNVSLGKAIHTLYLMRKSVLCRKRLIFYVSQSKLFSRLFEQRLKIVAHFSIHKSVTVTNIFCISDLPIWVL